MTFTLTCAVLWGHGKHYRIKQGEGQRRTGSQGQGRAVRDSLSEEAAVHRGPKKIMK